MMERRLSDAMPALLRPGGLYDQAEAALRRKLAADPHDTAALWKLAEIQRQRGDFAVARDGYRRLRVLGPDRRKAAWLHAVLGGDGVPEAVPPRRIWPVPFVWMRNFLAPGQCERLSALAAEGRARFVLHDREKREPRVWTPKSASPWNRTSGLCKHSAPGSSRRFAASCRKSWNGCGWKTSEDTVLL